MLSAKSRPLINHNSPCSCGKRLALDETMPAYVHKPPVKKERDSWAGWTDGSVDEKHDEFLRLYGISRN